MNTKTTNMKKLSFLWLLAAVGFGQTVFPPELAQYLNLSAAQKNSLEALETTFQSAYSNSLVRGSVLDREISALTAVVAPDPSAIGVRYAEYVRLRNESYSGFKQLGKDSLALLDDAQQAKVAALADSGQIFALVEEAYLARLIPYSQLDLTLPSGTATIGFYCCGAPYFSAALENYLGLTEPMTTQLTRISNTYQLVLYDIQNQADRVSNAIFVETSKESPDPDALGQLYVQSVALDRTSQATSLELANEMRAKLTADQKAKLKALSDADSQKLFVAEGACVNFFDWPSNLYFTISPYWQTVTPGGQSAYYGVAGGNNSSNTYGCGYFSSGLLQESQILDRRKLRVGRVR